jgi:prepilin-type N-terminal cleavage/methylation domain-containing protein
MTQPNRRRGFTLVELLMVVTIVGMLVALLLSAIQSAREQGRRTQCLDRIRQMAAAMQAFETANQHYPGWRHHPFQAIDAETARPIVYSTSWFPPLLPHLGHDYLLDRTVPGTFRRPIRRNREVATYAPVLHTVAVCPSDAEKLQRIEPLASYVVNCGRKDVDPTAVNASPPIAADWRANGMFHDYWDWRVNPNNRVATVKMDSSFIKSGDGLANTLMLSENRDAGLYFGRGLSVNNIQPSHEEWYLGFVFDPPTGPFRAINGPGFGGNYATARPSSNHHRGVNAAFASGAARFLSEDIDYLVYIALMTPKGAEAKEPGTNTYSAPEIRNGPKLSADDF